MPYACLIGFRRANPTNRQLVGPIRWAVAVSLSQTTHGMRQATFKSIVKSVSELHEKLAWVVPVEASEGQAVVQ
jgi:hypothetical protein